MERTSGKAPVGAEQIEDFYGVYLLYCLNPKYKGRTYIGFTNDPNRRISQHNKGAYAGGARRTSNRGPWDMVFIVHGFPDETSALGFEWAWQHPQRSKRLRHVPRKKSGEKSFNFCLRVVANMLNVGPWNRWPLTLRWLNPDFHEEFPLSLQPPVHMPIVYGAVESVKLDKAGKGSVAQETVEDEEQEELICSCCFKPVSAAEKMECLNTKCRTVSHIICLSQSFLAREPDHLILPVQGRCNTCDLDMLWGDLVRKRKGCYKNHQTEDIFDDD